MTEAEYKSRLHEIDQRYDKERMDLIIENNIIYIQNIRY